MVEQWLVDGYNLLHALQARTPRDPLSREDLFCLAAGFASFKKCDVLLVLDGAGPEADLEGYATTHFKAVFSQKGTADAYIERFLYEHRATHRMTVVTDDRAIADIGRGGGAQVLSTLSFAEMLKECSKENSDTLDKERSKGHRFNRPFEDKL